MRARLAACVNILRVHGADVGRPAAPPGRRSRLQLAKDLLWLANTLRKHAGVLPLPCTRADLDQAEQLSAAMVQALGEIAVADPAQRAAGNEQVRRAFTLLADVYDEAYAAIDYLLRSKGGARSLLPSLCHNPKRRDQRAAAMKDTPRTANERAHARDEQRVEPARDEHDGDRARKRVVPEPRIDEARAPHLGQHHNQLEVDSELTQTTAQGPRLRIRV